jgi:hypothetical protein
LYVEYYAGRERLNEALSLYDEFRSVLDLIGTANKIREWRIEEITRGTYKAIERAFRKR